MLILACGNLQASRAAVADNRADNHEEGVAFISQRAGIPSDMKACITHNEHKIVLQLFPCIYHLSATGPVSWPWSHTFAILYMHQAQISRSMHDTYFKTYATGLVCKTCEHCACYMVWGDFHLHFAFSCHPELSIFPVSNVQLWLYSVCNMKQCGFCRTFTICLFPAPVMLLRTSLPGKLSLAPHAPSFGWHAFS